MEMEYRHLGRSGLQVSVLSFGSWVTFGPQLAGGPGRRLPGRRLRRRRELLRQCRGVRIGRVGADHG
jgi:aryl-alcohol dehydrogenase-like predicted oxidoreductase